MSRLLTKITEHKLCVVFFLLILTMMFVTYNKAYGDSMEIQKLPQQSELEVFNPFSLNVTDNSVTQNGSRNNLIIVTPKLPKSVYVLVPIQIPNRPDVRSPFRPPLVTAQ